MSHIFLFLFLLTFNTYDLCAEVLPVNKLLIQTYGSKDLAEIPAFQGGYINFGYWKDIKLKNGNITKAERIKASEALYDLAIDALEIQPSDKVLEVGMGHGNGCVTVAKKFNPALITGIDVVPQQVARAKNAHQKDLKQYKSSLSFLEGSSASLPFPDVSYTKIYSVEAAQCFPSMEDFAKEAWRVLKPGGRLVVTAHFATNEEGYQALRKLIPTIDQGVDLLIPIQQVREAFTKSGFKEVSFQAIGKDVFEGWKQWHSQIEDVEWSGNIIVAYEKGYMGYYLLVLEK